MLAVNYTNARENFKRYCDSANDDMETIIITRKQGGNVVMLSEATYNNIMENMFIRHNKANYDRLMQSIDQLKQGKARVRELVEVDE